MHRFFVKHKLDINDTAHLSDSDSIFAINKLKLNIEDFIEIETYESIFLALIGNIEKSSVEVQIVKKIEDKESIGPIDITLVQSLIGKNNFNFFLEKSVEIGIGRIVPIQSQYSHIKKNKAIKEYGLWKKIIKDTVEQSRNITPTIIEKPINLKDLKVSNRSNRICLTTENIKTVSLNEYFGKVDIKKPTVIAIGPEKGWSSKDLEIMKEKGFSFVKLKTNILRAESAGLVVGSIIKYLKGEI